MLMRIVNRSEQSIEQSKLLTHVEPCAHAVTVDTLALHILSDQVRRSIVGGSSVEKFDDVGMIENSQCLPLVLKAPESMLIEQFRPHSLQRHQFSELVVGALGQINGTHSALTDMTQDFIKADALADHRVGGRRHRCRYWAFKKTIPVVVVFEQGGYFAIKFGIRAAQLRNVLPPALRVLLQGLRENSLGVAPDESIGGPSSVSVIRQASASPSSRAHAKPWHGSIRASPSQWKFPLPPQFPRPSFRRRNVIRRVGSVADRRPPAFVGFHPE